jgi:acyl-CoA synthetase (NDP forming)
MLALHLYRLVRQRPAYQPPVMPPVSTAASKLITDALAEGRSFLDEYESKQLLAAYGVPTVQEILTHSAAEAMEAAETLGYPLALKGCSVKFAHKTGKGLIHLNVGDKVGVQEAYRSVIGAAGQEIPLLVSKMVKGDRELMAGMVRHSAFGASVLFGLGGILAEALQDRTFRLAPLNTAEAQEMLQDIRAREILGPYRGMPAVDQEELAALLQAVGNLSLLHPEILEIDLNPIMISEAKPVVVDALVIINNVAEIS